ncbi:MAG: MFS transporter, partial [Acidimicrobiia bacterium]
AFVVGIGSVGFMTSSTSIVQLQAAPAFRGRVLALQAIVFMGSTPIGGPLIGWVGDTIGPRAAVMVGAIACLGAAAWGHGAFKEPEPTPLDATVVEVIGG